MKKYENLKYEYDTIKEKQSLIVGVDLEPIFTFMIAVESEVHDVLSLEYRLGVLEHCVIDLGEVIEDIGLATQDSGISKSVKVPKALADIVNGALDRRSIPLRPYFIVIFAYIETLFTLYNAYYHSTSDEKKLIALSHKNTNLRDFIEEFIINDNNIFYKKEFSVIYPNLGWKQIRDLRNQLTHFFSVGSGVNDIALSNVRNKSSSAIEQSMRDEGHLGFAILTPRDMRGLAQGLGNLLLHKRINDCSKEPDIFSNRINCVNLVVKKHGAKRVRKNK